MFSHLAHVQFISYIHNLFTELPEHFTLQWLFEMVPQHFFRRTMLNHYVPGLYLIPSERVAHVDMLHVFGAGFIPVIFQ